MKLDDMWSPVPQILSCWEVACLFASVRSPLSSSSKVLCGMLSRKITHKKQGGVCDQSFTVRFLPRCSNFAPGVDRVIDVRTGSDCLPFCTFFWYPIFTRMSRGCLIGLE